MAAPRPESTEEELDDPYLLPKELVEERRRLFEREVREKMNMSGEEFIRRWNAGEYEDVEDIPENWHILDLSYLIPFARK